MTLASVVLPDPFSPTSATTSPLPTRIETPFSACGRRAPSPSDGEGRPMKIISAGNSFGGRPAPRRTQIDAAGRYQPGQHSEGDPAGQRAAARADQRQPAARAKV